MLIGGDDISNDVITPGTCFSMFVYIRASPSFSRAAARVPQRACTQARSNDTLKSWFCRQFLSYSLHIFLVRLGEGGRETIQFTPVVVHESQEAVKVRRWAPCIYSLVSVLLFTLFTLPNLLNSRWPRCLQRNPKLTT